MKEKVQGFWDGVKALWGKLSHIARIVLCCVAAAVLIGLIALIVTLVSRSNQKQYVLLNNDFTRTQQALASAVLAEQGIDYTVGANGSILVLDKDENRARMQIAAAGLPGGIYESSYAPGLTSTQSDKDYIQNNELQKRLQSIIETYEEIEFAAVTISQPERGAFALQIDRIPPSADVTLKMKLGQKLSPEQVRAIQNLVKNSVPDIDEDHISISDESGDLLNTIGSGTDVNDAKLRLTEEVNSLARQRAYAMLSKIYGEENVEVQVNFVIDTDSRAEKLIEYVPFDEDDPTRNPLDFSNIRRSFSGNRQNIAEGVPGANDNVGTPEYLEEVNNGGEGLEYYDIDDTYDYLVSSIQTEFQKEGLEVVDATAAVLVNAANLPDGQRDQLMTMVAYATGVPVENVSVHPFSFNIIEEPAAPESPIREIANRFTPVQIAMLLILGFVVLAIIVTVIIIMVTRRQRRAAEEDEEGLEGVEYDENGMPLYDLLDQEEDFEPITMMETNEQKLRAQIKDLADSDPEIVASLLKNWLSSPS